MRFVVIFIASALLLAACSTLPREEWMEHDRRYRDYAKRTTFGATSFLEPYYVECMREIGAYDLHFGR